MKHYMCIFLCVTHQIMKTKVNKYKNIYIYKYTMYIKINSEYNTFPCFFKRVAYNLINLSAGTSLTVELPSVLLIFRYNKKIHLR